MPSMEELMQRAEVLNRLLEMALRPDKLSSIQGVTNILKGASVSDDDEFGKAWKGLLSQDNLKFCTDFPIAYAKFQKAAKDSYKTRALAPRSELQVIDDILGKLHSIESEFAHHTDVGNMPTGVGYGPRDYYGYSRPATSAGMYALQKITASAAYQLISRIPHSSHADVKPAASKFIAELQGLRSTETSVTVSSIVGPAVQEVRDALTQRRAEIQDNGASGSDEADFTRTDPTTFYNLLKSDASWLRGLSLGMDSVQVAGDLEFDGLCNALMGPFVMYMQTVLGKVVEPKLKDIAMSASALKAPSAEKEQQRRDLEGVKRAILDASSELPIANLTPRKPPALDKLISVLRQTRGKMMMEPGWKPSSSGSGKGGVADGEEEAPGLLHRTIDPVRVRLYVEQLEGFRSSLDHVTPIDSVNGIASLMGTRFEAFKQKMDGSNGKDPAIIAQYRDKLARSKVDTLGNACKMIRRTVSKYATRSMVFLTQQHREAFAYIEYWRELPNLVEKSVMQDVRKHAELRMEIKGKVDAALKNVIERGISTVATKMGAEDGIALSVSQRAEVEDALQELDAYVQRVQYKMRELWEQGPSIADTTFDSTMLIIYALKGLRLLIVWYGLRVAGRMFQALYDRRVYGEDEPPPHPALFVGILLLVDVAVQAAIVVILLVIQHVGKFMDAGRNASGLVTAWIVDYAMSTAVIGVLALIIGAIIRKKKYFRYRYEGDRGIRAMQQMIMHVYAVILCVPFYRLVYM